jgi:uncharacterized protein (DUF2141 family)
MGKDATLLAAVLLGLVSVLSYAQAPVPFISLPLMPDATAPGGAQFTLTVNGTGFVSNSVVNWNNSALATQFVSGSQLTATVPAADIATKSTGWVTVVNPAPGGGTSNTAFFTVTANEGNSLAFILVNSPAVGSYPYGVAVGDFNGDGKLDLVVANKCGNDQSCGSPGTVSILLGDGKGDFTLTSSPATGYRPSWVAVGDFNGDGKLDLAVANSCGNDPSCQSSGTVSILLGDGLGNFTLVSSPAIDLQPAYVAVGDFNGDGKLDLAVASPNPAYPQPGAVSVLLGDGGGNFTLAWTAFTTSGLLSLWQPNSLAVGDFNQDGKLDLAVFGLPFGPPVVFVYLGDGTGNFTLASTPDAGGWGYSVVAGDFNGDGKVDLAVANYFWSTVSTLLGDGTGQFTLAASIPTGSLPQALATGDFNGDNILDLAVVDYNERATDVMLGDGTGKFILASSLPGNVYPGAVAIGNFNGDGKLDVATVDGYTNTVLVELQHAPAVGLSPSNLTFGTQLVGTSSNPQPVTLTNIGSGTLRIGKIAASGSFSQTNNCPSRVPPNGQCTINVIFKPHKIGTVNGTLTIKDNAPASPQEVPLTGVGTVVSLQPPSLDFGNQKVGTTSPPQVVTLTNYGTRAVNIHHIGITGPNGGCFHQTNDCGTSVPAGGSCSISVTFTPKRTGLRNATLDVGDNGGGSPQTVALSGIGTK